jgi:phosphoribosylaminoimidazolecarboxamide formyltransferase / IMP cyclohydrolase
MKALISVFKKDGIVELAKDLEQIGCEIISTGGTLQVLKQSGINAQSVTDITNYPEIMDGRVKTLNPNIHGGILAKRDNLEHMDVAKKLNIPMIDIVIVNLYPFEETVNKKDAKHDEIIEMIDIGGPSMLRSASKNYKDVLVLVNPNRYKEVISELKEKGNVSEETRLGLALEAFQHTAEYDRLISEYFDSIYRREDILPKIHSLKLIKEKDLRYGENSHQKSSLYKKENDSKGLLSIKQLNGKEMSFNNYLDVNSAYEICKKFNDPTVVIVKHTNPCGVAIAENILEAYSKAYLADSVSAFGGIIAMNKECNEITASEIIKTFFEVIIAPSFSKKALNILKEKKNLRILEKENFFEKNEDFDYRKIEGAFLVQDKDIDNSSLQNWSVVTTKEPTKIEYQDLQIGWKIIPTVKSNAIILVKDGIMIGVGSGQMSRIEAVQLAIKRAGSFAKGSVLISDAFFPFSDSVLLCASAGITSIIQPGGSIKDEDSIVACNDNKISMVFTGIRHFRH